MKNKSEGAIQLFLTIIFVIATTVAWFQAIFDAAKADEIFYTAVYIFIPPIGALVGIIHWF